MAKRPLPPEHPSSPSKYGAPFSLRLTQEERKALNELADGQPLGAYIKDALLNRGIRPRTRGARPVKDRAALARLLGLLGASRLSQNINQLAKAANTGSLPVNEEVHRALLEGCAAIQSIRTLLLIALGLQSASYKEEQS